MTKENTVTDLPKRLNAGEPAPEGCVAVPLHGPGDSPGVSWGDLGKVVRMGCGMGITADLLQAVADAAEAEPPLRPGDRVRVDFDATVADIDAANPDDMAVEIVSSDDGIQFWVGPEHVTRQGGRP